MSIEEYLAGYTQVPLYDFRVRRKLPLPRATFWGNSIPILATVAQ